MFRKIRFYYLLTLTVLRKKKTLGFRLIFVILLLVLVLRLTSTNFWSPIGRRIISAATKTAYSEGLVGTVKSLNPIFETTEAEKELNRIVFRGLTRVDGSGELQSDLAESYEILSSTEYLFKLRREVYWHDGKPFSADDVLYTVAAAQDPNLATSAKTIFKDIKVEKIDDLTIKFVLKEPFAPFLEQTSIGIIPAHIPLNRYQPIGTGEFRVSYLSEKKVILTNSRQDLVFKLYPNKETAILALKQGEIKGLGGLTQEELKQFQDYPTFNLKVNKLPARIITIFFNTKAETVSEKLVRQALVYATSKRELLNLVDPEAQLASDSLSRPNLLKLTPEERFKFDLKKASSLLDASGWENKDGVRTKNAQNLKITLLTLAEEPFSSLAKKIGQDWSSLGIDFQIISLPREELSNVIKHTQFQVVLTTAEVSFDPDQYVLWHSTQINQGNITGLASAKVDKLLEDGRKTNALQVRKEKYEEFIRILADEAPAIFLYYPSYNWLVSKRIQGIEIDQFTSASDRFRGASSWKIPKFVI